MSNIVPQMIKESSFLIVTYTCSVVEKSGTLVGQLERVIEG